MNENLPKLSICMITYNHEFYIEQAINGVLNQEVDFEIELIIANDCSTDKTHYIISESIKKHPKGYLIKYFNHENNLGMMANFIFAIKQCKGKYIALLDGDDYWIDPLKLQKQVAFLENNTSFALCFHNVKVVSANQLDDTKLMLNGLSKVDFDTIDILKQWFIPTCSIVFRNYKSLELPYWFKDCISGDIPLLLLLSLHGKFHYINDVGGVYRKHVAGISNSHIGYYKAFGMVYIYQNFNVYTNYKFNEYVEKAILYELKVHLPEFKRKPNTKRVETDAIIIFYLKVKSRLKKLYNFFK